MLLISLPWETKAFFRKYFNEKTKEYYKKFIIYIVVTVIGCIITYYICEFILIEGIIGFILKIIICIFIPNIILIFICILTQNNNFKNVIAMFGKNK